MTPIIAVFAVIGLYTCIYLIAKAGTAWKNDHPRLPHAAPGEGLTEEQRARVAEFHRRYRQVKSRDKTAWLHEWHREQAEWRRQQAEHGRDGA